jgi:hypothetical protein
MLRAKLVLVLLLLLLPLLLAACPIGGEELQPHDQMADVGLSRSFGSDPASQWWLDARDRAGMVAITVANMPVPGFCRLAASAMIQGVPLTVLNWNQTLPPSMASQHGRRQGWQLLKYKSLLSSLRPSLPLDAAAARRRQGEGDLVVFVDGFDTFFVNDAASLVKAFLYNGDANNSAAVSAPSREPPRNAVRGNYKYNKNPRERLVMSAECNKSPASIDYGSRGEGSELNFVNSGFLVGSVDAVRELSAFIDGALEHLGTSLCPDGTSQSTFSAKAFVRPSSGLKRLRRTGASAMDLGRGAAEEVVKTLRCSGLPGVSDQLFAHYAYLLGVANVTLDKRAALCLNMFSCNRRGRLGFSPEGAVDVPLFSRTGRVSVRALQVDRRKAHAAAPQVHPGVIHANGNRKFLHWEQGIARALSSNAEWRSGCVRAVGPGVGDNDRCRSFAELGCNPSSLVLCDPATIGCKLSSSR